MVEAYVATGRSLSGADMQGLNLSGANLPGGDFFDADLSEADLSHARFLSANMQSSNLSRANLLLADLRNANLTGANLSGADLTGADLTKAVLTLADLSGADLSGANLLTANLSGAQLTEAILGGTNWNEAYCRDPAADPGFLCKQEELEKAGAILTLDPRPAAFSGVATIDNILTEDETKVVAMIEGEVVATSEVEDGRYVLEIPQPPNESFGGKEITFRIGYKSYLLTAFEISLWVADGGGELNLTATKYRLP